MGRVMSLTLDKWVHAVLEDMRKEFPILTRAQRRELLLVHLKENDPNIFMTLLQTRSMFKIKEDFEPIPEVLSTEMLNPGARAREFEACQAYYRRTTGVPAPIFSRMDMDAYRHLAAFGSVVIRNDAP